MPIGRSGEEKLMFRYKIQVKSIGMPRELLKGRGMAKIVKAGLTAAIDLWHEKFLPRHFRSGAFHRYKYHERTRHTLYRKRARARKLGRPDIRLPLIWTGTTRREVVRRIAISGNRRRMLGTMNSSHVFKRCKDGSPSYVADEITAVSVMEASRMGVVASRVMSELMQDNKMRKVIRIT